MSDEKFAMELFGKMWDYESPHDKTVWFAMQRGHMARQVDGFIEMVEAVMEGKLLTPATPADIEQRVEFLNSRVRYISQYAQAVYAARTGKKRD